MLSARSHSIASRSISVSNDKLAKKTEKLKLVSRSNTGIFMQILMLTRRRLKHRGIKLIGPNDREWIEFKDTCKLATDFCNEFQIEIKLGYKEYLEMGLKKMKNFSIHKFKSMHSAICNEYEAKQIIGRDKTPSKTEECHDIYLGMISQQIGYAQGYKELPEKYKYFVEAKKEAHKLGVSCKVYIAAQFEGFEWANTAPDPAQLVGIKAIERLQKYAFAHSITLGQKRETINWKKIKKKP